MILSGEARRARPVVKVLNSEGKVIAYARPQYPMVRCCMACYRLNWVEGWFDSFVPLQCPFFIVWFNWLCHFFLAGKRQWHIHSWIRVGSWRYSFSKSDEELLTPEVDTCSGGSECWSCDLLTLMVLIKKAEVSISGWAVHRKTTINLIILLAAKFSLIILTPIVLCVQCVFD